ncbi:LOW QUALITY PROTEIN: uridine phosphorylase 2 [Morus bassanus]
MAERSVGSEEGKSRDTSGSGRVKPSCQRVRALSAITRPAAINVGLPSSPPGNAAVSSCAADGHGAQRAFTTHSTYLQANRRGFLPDPVRADTKGLRKDNGKASGLVHIKNLHLDSMEEDIRYHLDLGTKTHNLPAMFADVEFVCVSGSPNRMRAFAQFGHKELGLMCDGEAADIGVGLDQYAMCKYHAHGMGIPSISVTLHELIKLLHLAKCDITIICIGTSGGLGIEAGSVVITDVAVDSSFKPRYEQVVLDNVVVWSTELDKDLVQEVLACSKEIPNFPTLIGHTMCTYDFYKGQRRLDGTLCSFSSEKKISEYLKRAYDAGVRNTEMESIAFAALCGLCGLKAAVVCVVLLDGLEGDQTQATREVLREHQQRPQRLAVASIRKRLGPCLASGNVLFSSN